MHFTQYIWHNANRMGCAASVSESTENGTVHHTTWLCCNYSNGNIFLTPIYTVGAPASQCKAGKHSKYEGLCKECEIATY